MLVKPGNSGETWTVTNELGAAATPLIVCEEEGWLFADTIADGETVQLELIDKVGLVNALHDLQRDKSKTLSCLLSLATKLQESQVDYWNSNYNYYNNYNEETWGTRPSLWTPTAVGDGETRIVDSIRPGSWWALTTASEYAAEPASGINYIEDFHIIHGNW
jgi:hypothetical protein